MKISSSLGIIAIAFALLPQVASATLLVGYNSFNNIGSAPDVNTTSGVLSSSMSYSGRSTGSSIDLFYGPDSTVDGGIATTAAAGRVNANGASLTATNTSLTESFVFGSLLFDMLSSAAGDTSFSSLTYKIGANPTVDLLATGKVKGAINSNVPATIATNYPVAVYVTNNYSDFIADLTGVSLLAGETIVFKWMTGTQVRLDNVALTSLSAIPETASVMALALLISGGLMTRNRRSIAAPTLA